MSNIRDLSANIKRRISMYEKSRGEFHPLLLATIPEVFLLATPLPQWRSRIRLPSL